MKSSNLAVREIETGDIEYIVSYWMNSKPEYLKNMGVDLNKFPTGDELRKMLLEQVETPYHRRSTYAVVWLIDGKPAGHCNVNKIEFGKRAYLHLHLWDTASRRKGMGTTLLVSSLRYFFVNLQLKEIYCEPYALNPAPHCTLIKAGFKFVKQYTTIPGYINFEQEVKCWCMSREEYEEIR